MSYLSTAWARLHEPRIVSLLTAFGYLGLGAGGVASIISPPDSLAGRLGEDTVTILAALLAWSGICGASAVIAGARWLERSAILSAALGTVLYLINTLVLHLSTPGNRLLQAAFIWFALIMLVNRWIRIRNSPPWAHEVTREP